MITDPKIQKLVDKIVRELQPEGVILFGSQAWGKPDQDSDLDLLIVQNSDRPRPERERALRKALFPNDIPIDILIYTPRELEVSINEDRNLFLEDIVRNGRVLFEQPGFFTPLFHRPAEILA